MRKPLIHSLLLALVFLSNACGNAKFNGKGKKKDKNQADQTTVVEPPCKEGETCVVVDPNCKAGEKDCPTPTTPKDPENPTTPPTDDCKDGGKDCPVIPPTDCDDEPNQNPGQNPGQNDDGKTCPDSDDDAGQNNPGQSK